MRSIAAVNPSYPITLPQHTRAGKNATLANSNPVYSTYSSHLYDLYEARGRAVHSRGGLTVRT